MPLEHPSVVLARETEAIHAEARKLGMKIVGEIFDQAGGSIKFVLQHPETGERLERWIIMPSNANLRGPERVRYS